MSFIFDHVAQQVPDIGEAVTWYRDLIPGTTVLYQDESWAFIEANGTKLAFVKKDQHPNHLAWRVNNKELQAIAAKYDQEIVPHRDNTHSFYLEAPGSQWIEIISFEGSDWEKSDRE